jgi:hypothetical protein
MIFANIVVGNSVRRVHCINANGLNKDKIRKYACSQEQKEKENQIQQQDILK